MANTVSIRPVYAALEVVRGTDNSFRLTITDTAGAAVPITGESFQFVARAKQGGKVRLSKALTISDGPNGVADLTLADDELAGLEGLRADEPVEWVYAIRRQQVSGAENVWFEGPFVLLPTASTSIA